MSSFRKNEEIEVRITDLTEHGEGVGKTDGFPVFIKDAVIGDTVRARLIKDKKTYAYGRLLEVLEASPDRVAAPCPVARSCGGCQIQEMAYPAQLAFKRARVQNHLERLGGFADVMAEPVLGMEEPWHYRAKTQVPVRRGRDGEIRMGFYAGRTHDVIETETCRIGMPEERQILDTVRAHMERAHIAPYDEEAGTGLVRHVLIRKGFATGEILTCLVINGAGLPGEEKLARELMRIPGMKTVTVNVNRARTNVILGAETRVLCGEGEITERIGDLSFSISSPSFFQVNPAQTAVLYGKALEFAALTGTETVWDIYCGTGSISLFLARRAARVFGNEISEAAVADARRNAVRNGIANAQFFAGRAEEVLPRLYREDPDIYRADVVVVDPPRKGCERPVLDTILAMRPERVVYVSCNSATFARDARILADGGYALKTVQPVDMFPHCVSTELVCVLSKPANA